MPDEEFTLHPAAGRAPPMRLPVFALSLVFLLAGCAPTSHLLPLDDGIAHLAPCPTAPHCVTSRPDSRDRDRIEPLAVGTDAATARARLLAVLAADPAFEVLSELPTENGTYVHAEYTTGLMRYQDDVEFLIRDDGRIDVRSSSRIGWYDWGANRNRIESLRRALAADGA